MLYYRKNCPSCGKNIGRESGYALESKIGSPTVTSCPYCGQKLTDGNKEWVEMNGLEKSREIIGLLISVFISFPLIGNLVVVLFSIFITKTDPFDIKKIIITSIISAIIGLTTGIIKIFHSIRKGS
jgi:DNA-directed RNA polymerase subunit RPC12/RpoP